MTHIDFNDIKLGLPQLDADHRELIELCERYICGAESGAAVEDMEAILDQLIHRTRQHFAVEERMLDRGGFPGFAAHRAIHERLLLQAQALRDGYRQESERRGSSVLAHDTAEFLRCWLIDHIRGDDRSYRPFMRHLS